MMLPTHRWSPLLGLLVALTVVAAFFRLWNFSDTLMFQGDQGRDALIVSQIFTKGDPVFIGPVTSVGNMYLGPLYYYLMLPFLYLSYPSPLGPAVAVAVLGILTVPLLYFLGKELIGKRGALIAAVLCTFSASAVLYSRFSWNPNPAPIVGLVMLWATYRAWRRSPWYWVVVAICFSILLQLHYIAMLSLGGAGLIWLLSIKHAISLSSAKRKKYFLQLVASTLISIVIVLVSLTPLALFDLKHDGLIHKAFLGLFTQEKILDKSTQVSTTAKIASIVKDSKGRAQQIFLEHTIGKHDNVNTIVLIVVLMILAVQFKRAGNSFSPGVTVILAYAITGVVGTAMYQHSLFEHYFAYLFPVGFLLFGLILAWLSRQHKVAGTALTITAVAAFIAINLPKMPLKTQVWTITDVSNTTHSIYEHLHPGETYSLVLLSPSKDLYAQNYRYFLSTTDRPPLPPEAAADAQTLVVINEEHQPNVAELPIYEIVTFPSKTVSEVYTIPNGPEILIYRRPAL